MADLLTDRDAIYWMTITYRNKSTAFMKPADCFVESHNASYNKEKKSK